MKTIEIYCNYGVLAAEKRNVYTFGAEHPHATCSDKMMVVVPDGWELYQNQMGQTMVTAPWGWDYDINEVLTDIKGRAAFRALDKNMSYKTAFLFTPEEITEKEEQRKQKMKEYTVLYRERGNKQGQIFETSVTADNAKEAKEGAREDLFECYVIVSVKLSR